MATFAELQQQQQLLSQKLLVLTHLVEHIDENFRGSAGCEPKQKLLDPNNVPLPPAVFESVVSEVLLATANQYKAMLENILKTEVAPQAPVVLSTPTKKSKHN